MSGVGRLASSVLFASLFVAGPAYGAEGFALSWRTAEPRACVTSDALRDAVERRLGRSPFTDPEHASISIEGEEVSLGRDHFRARVTQKDRSGVAFGSRDLEPQSCSSLLRAAVLVVSLFIERNRELDLEVETEAQPRPSEPPARSLRGEPPPPVARAPRPSRAPAQGHYRPTLELWIGGGAGASAGLLPSVDGALFATGRLEVSRSRWSFEWRGGYHLPQRVVDREVGGVFSAIDQQLYACISPARWAMTRFDVCGGLVWATVIPQTSGTQKGNDSWRGVAGPSFMLALQFEGRPAAARLALGLALPLRQYTFVYTNPEEERKSFYSTSDVLFIVSIGGLRTIS